MRGEDWRQMIPHMQMPFITLTEPECWAIIAVAVFILLDIVAGMVGAVVRHDFQSSKMREGLGHKAMLVLVVALAVLVQGFTTHVGELGFNVPLIVPVCVYIVLMEVASVLETVAQTYPALADSPLFRLFNRKEG